MPTTASVDAFLRAVPDEDKRADCRVLVSMMRKATGAPPRIMSGCDAHPDLLRALGPHRTGKSCLYLKRLADVDRKVLARLVERSVAAVQRAYPGKTASAKTKAPARPRSRRRGRTPPGAWPHPERRFS